MMPILRVPDLPMPDTNPLLQAWQAPHGLPPFSAIRPGHFEPAFTAAMQAHRDELRLIADDGAAPDFDNTVAAFDRSGRLFARILAVLRCLSASATSPHNASANPAGDFHSG